MSVRHISPEELMDEFRGETASISNSSFFADPRFKKQREKWVAATFATALKKANLNLRDLKVGIVQREDDEADFELLVDRSLLRFQVTGVQTPGRRRGDEYNTIEKGEATMLPYKPQEGMLEGPCWIASAVKSKFEKKYSTKPLLMIFAK